ncbi:MAG: cyclic nucleotide-binding domain-containing protein [Myxococcota bacterium]
MLSTVARLMLLKSVETFRRVPDRELADVAILAREESTQPGEPVLEQGETCSTMYVVVSGEVRVHAGGRNITTLGPRAVFGELSVLAPAPRAASVTATEETLLLALDHESLYEVMSDHVSVARGIIEAMAERIRGHEGLEHSETGWAETLDEEEE